MSVKIKKDKEFENNEMKGVNKRFWATILDFCDT